MYFRKSHVRADKLDVQKQISVPHSSTEAEVISLDAGLRMDGIPGLTLWDLVIEVFRSSTNQTDKTKDVREPRGNLSTNTQPAMRQQIPTTHTNHDLTNIDHVPSNVTHSGANVIDENKRSKSTMRHVSRTHRVALDLTRVILIPKFRFTR